MQVLIRPSEQSVRRSLTVFSKLARNGSLTDPNVQYYLQTGEAGALGYYYSTSGLAGTLSFFQNPFALGAGCAVRFGPSSAVARHQRIAVAGTHARPGGRQPLSAARLGLLVAGT